MKSASLKKFSELLFGEFQFANVKAHGAARNGSIAVRFMESYDRWISAQTVAKSLAAPCFLCLEGPYPSLSATHNNWSQVSCAGSWTMFRRCRLLCGFQGQR